MLAYNNHDPLNRTEMRYYLRTINNINKLEIEKYCSFRLNLHIFHVKYHPRKESSFDWNLIFYLRNEIIDYLVHS